MFQSCILEGELGFLYLAEPMSIKRTFKMAIKACNANLRTGA